MSYATMAEQQLVDYIKKARQAGQSEDQTRTLLYKNGWTEAEVNDALASLTQPQPQPRPQPQIQPQPQPQAQQQPQYQPKPQPQPTQSQSQAQPRPQPQPQQQIQAQPQPQPQPQIQQSPQANMPSPAQILPKQNLGGQARKSHLVLKLLLVLIVVVFLCGAGYLVVTQTDLLNKIIPTQTKSNENTNTATTAANFVEPAFAKYSLESTKYKPAIPNYQLSLSELTNLNNFQKTSGNFSTAETNSLTTDNFFIARNNDKFYSSDTSSQNARRNDDWTTLYGAIGGGYADYERQPQNSVFVTTDFLTHTYHKLIDEEFSYIEENNFYPTLDELSKNLLKQSASAYSGTTDQNQKDSYERLSSYFLVTSSILENAAADYNKFKQANFVDDSKSDTKAAVLALTDSLAKSNNVSDNAKNIAKQEITLIFDANQIVPSPLMGKYQPDMSEDYTQYGPRSHYTKNVILRDYFRAMMFYGRMNFLLKSPELTRDAANITQLLSTDELKQWESIYQPTTFFVGKSDDLTVYEYSQAEKKTGFTPSDESDPAVSKLQSELLTYPNPQIMSSIIVSSSVTATTKEDLQKTTKGFRFMGQRFTPDAFIFSTLTQGDETPDPATGQKLPSTPTALMVSTLMGSKESATLLDAWIKDSAPNSDKVLANRMATLQDYFNKTTQQQWTQNIYWSWLYTIKSLFTDSISKTGYPMFVKSEDWDKKTLQTFLGSWTELKHDTLLYAKQSYAELGAGGPGQTPPPNPVPKGYVEPNVVFFDRLISLVNLTDDGLKQFGILPSNFESRNTTFLDSLKFYRTIAVSELQNQKISDDDFEKLRLSAGQLDQILQAPDSQVSLESNARSALIADVHTDTKKGQILYEADGIPNYIYVAVKDANGTRLTKGLVYSYYEFTGPLAKRYTDQTWQGWEYTSAPQKLQMPWWNKDLVK